MTSLPFGDDCGFQAAAESVSLSGLWLQLLCSSFGAGLFFRMVLVEWLLYSLGRMEHV